MATDDDNEILIGLATDNRMHWFKSGNVNCGKYVKYFSAGTKDDLVCKNCYKAIIKWMEISSGKFSS